MKTKAMKTPGIKAKMLPAIQNESVKLAFLNR